MAAASLTRLDSSTALADIVTEPDFEVFRRLAGTFGRQADAIIPSPSSREDTDPILLDLVRSHLVGVDPEIAKLGLAATFRAAQAAQIHSQQQGQAGRGGGGIKALVSYFDKVLPRKAADAQAAESERVRKEQVGLAAERAIAEKRLEGAGQGSGPRRVSRASLDEIAAKVFGSEPQEA